MALPLFKFQVSIQNNPYNTRTKFDNLGNLHIRLHHSLLPN
jgi:hypothetical protein